MATMESSKSVTGPAQGPSNMSLNATKAGMTGLDTEKINSIIAEASKGSNFFKMKEKSQAKLDEQVRAMVVKRSAISQEEVLRAEGEADIEVAAMVRYSGHYLIFFLFPFLCK